MRLRGTVRQIAGRDGWWYYARQGKAAWQRFGGRTRQQAEDKRRAVSVLCERGMSLADAVDQVWPPPEGSRRPVRGTSFAALARLYRDDPTVEKKASTRDRDRYRIDRIVDAEWARRPATGLDRIEVRDWTTDLRAGGMSIGTVNDLLALCSAVLRHAEAAGWIGEGEADNPFLRLRAAPRKVQRKRMPSLDLEELRHWLTTAEEVLDPAHYLLVLAAACTGWRYSELGALTWGSVQLDYHHKGAKAPRMVVSGAQEKTGTTKAAHLAGPLLRLLTAERKRAKPLPAAPVFRQPHGAPYPVGESGIARRAMLRVNAACSRKKIPEWKLSGDETFKPLTIHGLRHTYAAIALGLGVPESTVNAQAGWGSPARTRMALHYAGAPESSLIEAARTFAAALAPKVKCARKRKGSRT